MEKAFRRLVSFANNRTYKAIEILLKKRIYSNDKNYQINSIERCFEDRINLTGDDSKLLTRIVNAYQAASRDQPLHSEVFRPSNEWLPIYRGYLGDVITALEDGDTKKLDKIYRNFFRDPCSTGLVGLHANMEKDFFNGKISHLSKLHYLNDSIHRFNLWKKLLGNQYTCAALSSPLIGNPYGYFIDNQFIRNGADYQHYYATTINALLDQQARPIVAEIGGGYGGMAYYLIRDAKNTQYIDFDLPENLALTTYYLLKAFPEKKFLLYGEADISSEKLDVYDIVLMPSFQLDKLRNGVCDLIFNSYSLAEMSPATIHHYINQSALLLKSGGWFFHVNHTKHSIVSAKDFPVPNDLKLMSEKVAEWNSGRNWNMDESEFLYQKK
jgi:putative sugar O-methyltransferase